MMRVKFAEHTRTEIGEIAPNATAVVPVAATEQHGPHLPVMVDTLTAESIALEAARAASPKARILVCPVVSYGASDHHLIFPGTLSLSTQTLGLVLRDIGNSLAAGGFRRIYFLNGHGGNDEAVRLAARELALRHDVIAGAASYWTIAWESIMAEGRAGELGKVPGHAGGFETSLTLALRKDLVHAELLPLSERDGEGDPSAEPAGSPSIHTHGSWAKIDGYSDSASKASESRGRELFRLIVQSVAQHLIRFHESYPDGA